MECQCERALVAGLLGEHVVGVGDQAGLGHGPLVRGEQQDVRAGGVHLVRLARVDGLLLHRLDLQRVQLLVEHLAPARQPQGNQIQASCTFKAKPYPADQKGATTSLLFWAQHPWPSQSLNVNKKQCCYEASRKRYRRYTEGGAQVHDDGLVDLLPQVSAHDLDKRDLQRRNLACAVNRSCSGEYAWTQGPAGDAHC